MSGSFDESQHPRAPDGKFGAGSGGSNRNAEKRAAAVAKGKKAAKTPAEEIEKGYLHVVRGEYDKAKSLFEKHGHVPHDHVKHEMAKNGHPMSDGARSPAPASQAGASKESAVKAPTDSVTSEKTAPSADTSPPTPPTNAKTKTSPVKLQDPPPASPTTQVESVKPLTDSVASKSAFQAAAKAMDAPATPNGTLSEAFGQGVKLDGGKVDDFTPEGMKAMRGHFDGLVAAKHLPRRDGPQSGEYHVWPDDKDKAPASATRTGLIGMQQSMATALYQHSHYDPKAVGDSVRQSGGRHDPGLEAFHGMVHESVHQHGPEWGSDSPSSVFHEEITTELVARQITAKAHGIEAHELGRNAAYIEAVNDVINEVSGVTGAKTNHVFDALSKSALDHKRSTKLKGDDEKIDELVSSTLKRLGSTDPRVRTMLISGMHAIAKRHFG